MGNLCSSDTKKEYDKYHENELIKNSFTELSLFSLENLVTKCKVTDVYDGDTVTIVFYYDNKPMKVKLRMYGYDSPEVKPKKSIANYDLHKKAGEVARDKLKEKIEGKIMWVKFVEREKYGREMGFLFEDTNINCDFEKSINSWMIVNKLGKKYQGSKKDEFSDKELQHILSFGTSQKN